MPPRLKPRGRMAIPWRQLIIFVGLLLVLLLYNEFLVYYIVLLQCSWPVLDSSDLGIDVGISQGGTLKAMFLADTHLLGSREGHWFDKLRREWQMERSFQTAMTLFHPNTVFFLGDLFDEGKWASDGEFHYYVAQFNKMFHHPSDVDVQVLVGNHDIGFHYMSDEHKRKRFSSTFDAASVRKFHKKDNIFVMLNSMAFEGDNCDMCLEAGQQLDDIAFQLDCSKGTHRAGICRGIQDFKYSRPILLQHFPMYRESDSNCTGPDSAPPYEKYKQFKPKWDCLSSTASQKLFEDIQPRLIISGHTHHFCHHIHGDGTHEWTVPSFSWRNKKNPSFLLITLDNTRQTVSKCYLPHEDTVIYTYIIGGAAILLWFFVPWLYNWRYSTYSYTKIS